MELSENMNSRCSTSKPRSWNLYKILLHIFRSIVRNEIFSKESTENIIDGPTLMIPWVLLNLHFLSLVICHVDTPPLSTKNKICSILSSFWGYFAHQLPDSPCWESTPRFLNKLQTGVWKRQEYWSRNQIHTKYFRGPTDLFLRIFLLLNWVN